VNTFSLTNCHLKFLVHSRQCLVQVYAVGSNHMHNVVTWMPNDRLPKKLLFGEVKELRPPGRPRSSFNDVALRDCQDCRISRPYRDAQDRLLWRDKTCPART